MGTKAIRTASMTAGSMETAGLTDVWCLRDDCVWEHWSSNILARGRAYFKTDYGRDVRSSDCSGVSAHRILR